MSKHSLKDLNEYLFNQMDALTNEDLTEQELETELKRTKSLTDLSKTIIDSARVVLDAQKHADDYGYGVRESKRIPSLIGGSDEE